MAELAEALLAATGEARVEQLEQADVAELESAIAELGHRREPAAAEVLRLIDSTIGDRALRKAARRELHRLESAGIRPPQVQPEPATPPADAPPAGRVTLREAWATDIDPPGTRTLWLMGEPRLGGAWLAMLLLHELEGIQQLSLVDTTRKRFQRDLEQARADARTTWVSLPPEYALQLVREAVDLMRSQDQGLPTRYRTFKELFGEAEHAPERALVYETIGPLEASYTPELLAESTRLFGEREVAGWMLLVDEELRARALEVVRAAGSSLVLPTNPPEQQALRLLQDAARQLLTDARRRALRRRLEETAYIFVTTERLAAARVALAAARALEDPTLGPTSNLFLRVLLTSGFAAAIRTAPGAGGRTAAATLSDLFERGVERESAQPAPETITPSGLILPR